jgi:protein-S-isoprenylcysteine O-methyltransferase Ste14
MLAGKGVPWWKGVRGEWLVVTQLALIALVFFGPRTISILPEWGLPWPDACRIAGWALIIAGSAFLFAGLIRLGKGLTPLPYPKDGMTLIETGPYALVRHPMYSGGLALALGWALFVRSGLTVGYVVSLFVFLDLKSRREEKWLMEKFSAYRGYQERVRRLIPFVY